MATFSWCLCLILILSTTGSRWAAGSPPRSPDSSVLWNQDAHHYQSDAANYRKAGDFASAEKLYRQGYEDGVRHGDPIASVKYLISVGGCQLARFQYTAALSTFVEARALASADGVKNTSPDLGAIAVNLSSLYLQVWDVSSALRAVEDGLAETKPAGYSRPFLMVQAGRIHALLNDGKAGAFFADGIEAARASGLFALESQGWDLLGDQALRDERLGDAEFAFGEAFRARTFGNRSELGLSYFRLAALRLAHHDPWSAARLNALATPAANNGASSRAFTWPEYMLTHQRGLIRQALGQTRAALEDFSIATDAAARASLQVLPTRAALVANNVAMEERIFRSYIQLAARQAAETGDTALAGQAFQAVETSRAASLRSSLGLADAWRSRLPQEYWRVSADLAKLDAQQMQSSQNNGEADRLRLKLSEMETQAGGGISHKKMENFRGRSSLTHFQQGLRDSELILSFYLGKTESYMWTVSRAVIRMHRLPPETHIAAQVHAFREAVRTGNSEAEGLGKLLYRTLFGELTAEDVAKRVWLLSLEGVLFEAPFAALVTERRDGSTAYLVEQHNLQVVPGALLSGASAAQESAARADRTGAYAGVMLAVGDPVYNTADLRWSGVKRHDGQGQLDRLVASAAEVSVSAARWRASGGTANLLTGTQANRAAFVQAIAGAGRPAPAVIHLATHVLTPVTRAEQGFIAFGLSGLPGEASPRPGYLATSEIATLHVPEALVVMTGCATGTGDARSGAGLLGLTRAWLMAGARGVISTAWPVEDSPGEIFSLFYRYLSSNSPAEALRLSQLGMIHSGTWRRAPAYWASYQFTGRTR